MELHHLTEVGNSPSYFGTVPKYRLGRVTVRNSKQIIGRYRDNDIEINREPDGSFYIYVHNPFISFGTSYDGWWGSSENTIAEALQQAFKGSMIAEPRKAQEQPQPTPDTKAEEE